MTVTGIICEYNPLHNGHAKQLDTLRQTHPDGGIVCLMSGNYVQRGHPAIIDKQLRARAAVLCGADLILELPVTASLSSAEGFASQGVQILDMLCDELSFGAENADKKLLMALAAALLTEEFSANLKSALSEGLSFPSARQKALERMGLEASVLAKPNNILAVEYCKAILSKNLQINPVPITRKGDYHDLYPDLQNPSATALRQLMVQQESWQSYIPLEAAMCFENASLHTADAGERAVLARLRSMSEEEFEALPYGSEGLWRKLMHTVRECASLEEVLSAVKSKRYTRTRLDRMVMCAFLGLIETDLSSPVPYCRVLAFNDRGRDILKNAKKSGFFPNIGEKQDHPFQKIENRCSDLYGLFAVGKPEAPGKEQNRRVYYHQEETQK